MAKLNYERVSRENKVFRQGIEYLDSPQIGSYTDVKINKVAQNNRSKSNKQTNIQLVTCPRCNCKIKSTRLKKHLESRCPGKTGSTKKPKANNNIARKQPVPKKQRRSLVVKRRGDRFRKGYDLLQDEIINYLKLRKDHRTTKNNLIKDIVDAVQFLPSSQRNNLIEILLYSLSKNRKIVIDKNEKTEDVIRLMKYYSAYTD